MSYKTKPPQQWTKRDKQAWQIGLGTRLREAIHEYYGPRNENKFAKDLGISQGSLADILNGHTSPSALTLLRILSIKLPTEPLGIDILDILGGY